MDLAEDPRLLSECADRLDAVLASLGGIADSADWIERDLTDHAERCRTAAARLIDQSGTAK